MMARGLMIATGPRYAGHERQAYEPEAHWPWPKATNGPTCPLCFGGGGGDGRANTLAPAWHERSCERRCAGGRSIGTRAVVRPDRRQFVRALRSDARTPLLEVRANGRSLLRGEHPSGVLRLSLASEVRSKVRANELTADPEFARELFGAVCLCIRHVCDFSVRSNGRKSPIRVVRLRTDLRLLQITRMAGLEFVRTGATNVMANAIPHRSRANALRVSGHSRFERARMRRTLGCDEAARSHALRVRVCNARTNAVGSANVLGPNGPCAFVRLGRDAPPLLPRRGRSDIAKRCASERAKRRSEANPRKSRPPRRCVHA